MYYFDYAASCYTDKKVMDIFVEHELTYYPHPNTYQKSIDLRETTKNKMLETLKMTNKEVIFTSGGTEANNLAILGFAKTLTEKKEFICATYEHSSVSDSMDEVEKLGHIVKRIKPQTDGRIKFEDIKKEINDNTAFISLMSVNNEIGVANEIESIAKNIKAINNDIVIFSDFVQGIGKIKLINFDNIDLVTISSHKIYGLKAKGALIKNKDLIINKILFGGVLENNMRAGSQSVASEVAFAKALELAYENLDSNIQTIKSLMTHLVTTLESNPKIKANIIPDTNVLSIYINSKHDAKQMKQLLLEKDILISTKSACSFDVCKPNPSITCLGFDNIVSDKSIRISISHHTNIDDIDFLCENINQIIN
jgi:cysteine desulfurase